MNYLPHLLLLAAVLWVASCEHRTHFFYLQVLRFSQFLRALPLRLKLEWEIYKIKNSHDKYLKMAEQITKELTDETNHQ